MTTIAPNPLHAYRRHVIEAWAVWAALESGLFARLLDKPSTLTELSLAERFDPSALEALVEALVTTGNLQRRAETLYVPPELAEYYRSGSPRYIGKSFAFLRNSALFEHYPRLLAEGGTAPLSAAHWSRIALGSAAHLRPALETLWRSLPELVDQRLAVLDVGCGRGDYSAELCRRNPQIRALGIDPTESIAEEARRATSEITGMNVRCCQLSDVSEDFDVILINHVFHVVGRTASRQMLEQAARRLRPGGVVLVQEILHEPGDDVPLFGLTMRLSFEHAAVFTRQDLSRLAETAGYRSIDWYPIEGGSINAAYQALRTPRPV